MLDGSPGDGETLQGQSLDPSVISYAIATAGKILDGNPGDIGIGPFGDR